MAIQNYTFETSYQSNKSQPDSKELLNEHILQDFTNKIKNCFPTYVAAVMADRHGFLVHSEINNSLDENMLALTAVAGKRKLLKLSKYHSIVRSLSRNVKLLVLLKKSHRNYAHFGHFDEVVKKENPI